MVGPQLAYVLRAEPLVYYAMTSPGNDLHAGLLRNVLRQILVRQHDDALGTERLDDPARITGRAADVRLSLHCGGRIHISYDRHAWVMLARHTNFGRCDRIADRAALPRVGNEHSLRRVTELSR